MKLKIILETKQFLPNTEHSINLLNTLRD